MKLYVFCLYWIEITIYISQEKFRKCKFQNYFILMVESQNDDSAF